MSGSLTHGGGGGGFPEFPVHAKPDNLRIWQGAHARRLLICDISPCIASGKKKCKILQSRPHTATFSDNVLNEDALFKQKQEKGPLFHDQGRFSIYRVLNSITCRTACLSLNSRCSTDNNRTRLLLPVQIIHMAGKLTCVINLDEQTTMLYFYPTQHNQTTLKHWVLMATEYTRRRVVWVKCLSC